MNEARKLKVGDTVRFKASGVILTIIKFKKAENGCIPTVVVTWKEAGKAKIATINYEDLIVVDAQS